MSNYIVSNPSMTFQTVEDVKEHICLQNSLQLLTEPYVVTLLGNPNEAFTDEVCNMLAELNILNKEPWCQSGGKPITIKLEGKEIPLYKYSWGEVDFGKCSAEQLNQVAWDLRYHGAFTHVWAVDPVEDKTMVLEEESPVEKTYHAKTFESDTTFFCAVGTTPWRHFRVTKEKKIKLSERLGNLNWKGYDD